jgi:hypothetical protein
MSVQRISRSCRLKRFEFPKYWEQIVENPTSAEQALARIKELHSSYESEEGEGICFFIEDDQGEQLHVGCSDEGWVLTYHPKKGAVKAAVGDLRARGHKPFLIPEWTDIERKHLIAAGVAETAVSLWIKSGRLSDSVTWVE